MTMSILEPKPHLSISASLTFRSLAKPEDLPAISEILKKTGFFYDFEIKVALELLEDRLNKGESSDYHFIFADQEGSPVGFCCFGPLSVAPSRYDLYWIAVHPNVRNSGIGSQLLQTSEEAMRCKGGKIIYIETSSRAQYEPTRFFYLKNKYQEVARVPNYYADDDDRLIFMKTL